MKVKVFSPYPEKLARAFQDDEVVETDPDFIVSFGNRTIFTPSFVGMFPGKIINIHIALLPWNRGSDPNFWSWFDNTKKGVTIHYIDNGIDTGDLIFQSEITKFQHPKMTLATTYNELMETAVRMFEWSWPSIKRGSNYSLKQATGGSTHKRADFEPWKDKLPKGWDTPVSVVEEMGRRHRDGK